MTVFMGTRQRYQLKRFEVHSAFAIISSLCLVMIPCSVFFIKEEPQSFVGAVGVTSLAVASKKGRKVTKRLVNESFYGCLFKFTGVFHTKGATRVGG